MEITYRRRNGSEKWHFCVNCSTWPTRDYIELETFEHHLQGSLCLECVTRRHLGQCSMVPNSSQ
ncbi:MAG TPA: hypothetical protein VGH50_03990 [Candidatus Binatia bacterium]